MKAEFNLVFDVREDGTKVWAADCRRCGAVLVGERNPPVVVVSVKGPIDPGQFERFKQQVGPAWDRARSTGRPLATTDNMTVTSVPDHSSVQSALEAHEAACPKVKEPE